MILHKKFCPLIFSIFCSVALADQSLIYVVNNESDSFDPGTSSESFAAPIIGNTFEGLIRTDEKGQIEAALAKTWEISEDGLTYRFTLRPDARWSDGKPVTAHDFEYAWRRALNPASGAKNVAMLYHIDGAKEHYKDSSHPVAISAIDDDTLSFTLKYPVPYMMHLLNAFVFYPVREDIVAANPTGWTRTPDTFIGTGPFKMTALELGKNITFEKNPYYYEADKVSLDHLTLQLIANQSTALAALEAGDVDGIDSVPSSEIPRLSVESKAFKITPALSTAYAIFNSHTPPLNDLRVRKALSLAIDREEIVEFVLQSADLPAVGLVPFGIMLDGLDFRDALPSTELTPTAQITLAQTLLAEAGYANGKGFPDTVYGTYASPPVQKLLQAIQQMWKKNLNIEVAINVSEWKVYYPEIQNGQYQIAQMGWGADYPHPMSFLNNFISSSPNNLAQWQNSNYDQAIAKAQASTSQQTALRAMVKAETILMQQHIIMPLYHRNSYMMMNQNITGFWRSLLGVPYFRKVTFKKAQ